MRFVRRLRDFDRVAFRLALSGLFGAFVVLAVTSCAGDSGSRETGSDDPGGGNGTGNVTLSATCSMPATCGGELAGSWDLVDACIEGPPEGEACSGRSASGTVSGSFSFSGATAGSTLEVDARVCGRPHEESAGSGGMATIAGNTLTMAVSAQTWIFCVEGDSLWLRSPMAMFPELTVARYRRRAPAP
ncbi:MAG TPA: hypothetical protein VF103_14400 [Polyangiaceae bacterium]